MDSDENASISGVSNIKKVVAAEIRLCRLQMVLVFKEKPYIWRYEKQSNMVESIINK
jgi:hypothetical protein